jgi:hypothetical protein
MEIRPVKRSGMLTFAGVVLVLAGAINLLDGIVALTKDEYFRADQLLFGDLSAWGFWWLFVGLLMLWAGSQVVQRKESGLGLGVGIAGLNIFTQLMFIKAYPGWSISIMVLDLIVIWALCANADEFE